MKARIVTVLASGAALTLAVLFGGPQTFGGTRLGWVYGAREEGGAKPPCNTTGLKTSNCFGPLGTNCGTTYDICKSQTSGVQQFKLCDPGNGAAACTPPACSWGGNPANSDALVPNDPITGNPPCNQVVAP